MLQTLEYHDESERSCDPADKEHPRHFAEIHQIEVDAGAVSGKPERESRQQHTYDESESRVYMILQCLMIHESCSHEPDGDQALGSN